jgi:hypothetical protein
LLLLLAGEVSDAARRFPAAFSSFSSFLGVGDEQQLLLEQFPELLARAVPREGSLRVISGPGGGLNSCVKSLLLLARLRANIRVRGAVSRRVSMP